MLTQNGRTAQVLHAPHKDARLRPIGPLRRPQKCVSNAAHRFRAASAARAEPSSQAVPTVKPSVFERVCGSLLFVFPAAEGLYRLHLLSVDYLSKRAYEILWSARQQAAAAAASSANTCQDSALLQPYENMCATASSLHGRVQGLADDLNSFLQPISLQSCSEWLHAKLQALLALPVLEPITSSVRGAHESLMSWTAAHHATSTASLSGGKPELGQAAEGFPKLVLTLWAWVQDVLLQPPSLHSLSALSCFGLGLLAIAWSLDRCVKQQQGGHHPQQPAGMLSRLHSSATDAFAVKRPELVLASALGAVLLRLAFAPLLPPCTGVQGNAEQLVHDLYVTSSTFLSIATFYVACGSMYRVLSAPLPYRPISPSTPAPSAPASPAAPKQQQQQQQQQRLTSTGTSSTSPRPAFIPNPTPTAYDAPTPESSTPSSSSSTVSSDQEASSSGHSYNAHADDAGTSGHSRATNSRQDSSSHSSSSGRTTPHEPQQPVLFSILGVFGASAAAVPHIASRLPRAVIKTFQEGALREILQAVEASAAFHAACMTFYTFASLLLNTNSTPASLINTVFVYLLYRGCVEGVLVEVRGLLRP